MREIKFRAMNEIGNWVYFSIWGINPPLDKKKFKNLCEFTGLKDKNEKEIYEGDILELDGGGEPCLGSVGFERGCFVFNADWLDKKKEYMPELYRYTFFAELKKGKLFKDCVVVKIVGNIYENSNLLEAKQ